MNLEDVKGRFGLNLTEKALQYFQSLPTYSDRVEQVIEQLSEKVCFTFLHLNYSSFCSLLCSKKLFLFIFTQILRICPLQAHLLYLEEDQTLQDCAEMDDRSSVGSCDIIQDYKKSGGYQSRSNGGSLFFSLFKVRTLGFFLSG